mgnify:CR=1 FL=1|tara:strand:+ start:2238 stop:4469 length:2232 start_codon:yes stop_codon:yes gene_type:complete
MNIIKSNPELNNMFKRIRNRRRLAEALEENNIDVETTAEKEQSEGSGKTEFEEQLSGLGIDAQTVGVSQSIQDASEMMDVAGVGAGQTAGQVARDIAKENRSFADPFAEAVTSLGGREGLAAKAGLATYGSLLAGQTELAKGLYTGTQMLAGPAGMALNVIGPTELDPYGQPVAMGSGAFGKVSSKVMDIHYNVADKMAQGIAGYDQGRINGQLVSVSPGFFGGKVLTGNIPVGMTADDFTDLMEQAAAVEDEDAISGYAQGNPAAMMEAGITVDDYGSSTQAAQAGIGYSSYDAQGNPTGAAPAGSQYSATGIFSDGDDNNDSDVSDDAGPSSDTSGDLGGEDVAYGGKISMQMGGDPAQQQTPTGEMGFVGGPPDQFTEQQTIADDIPKTVPEGAFVINAPAVEFAGKEDIKQMLVKAYEIVAQADIDAGVDKSPRAAKIPSKEQVDIMISRGEVIVPPEIAKIIGYDRLEKINNRGKKEVARRQEESQKEEKPQAKAVAEGGAITTLDDIDFKNFYSSPEEARRVIDDISKKLPLADTLAILIEGEAEVLGDEGLEGAAHVLVNRANAEGYKDFGKSLDQELTKKTYGKNKIFQFNALEPTKFRKTLNKFKKDQDRYLKVRNIAEEVLAGAREDFTGGALFFKNPTSSKAKDFKKMVDSGELIETTRTVSSSNPNMMHIYFKPKDFGVITKKQPNVNQGFIDIPAKTTDQQSAPQRPESRGGSFLFRGSDYERGGATPAF